MKHEYLEFEINDYGEWVITKVHPQVWKHIQKRADDKHIIRGREITYYVAATNEHITYDRAVEICVDRYLNRNIKTINMRNW